MSGRHPWSEITKRFTPEQRQRAKEEAAKMRAEIERERHAEIHIPPIALEWSGWHWWGDVEEDARQGGGQCRMDSRACMRSNSPMNGNCWRLEGQTTFGCE